MIKHKSLFFGYFINVALAIKLGMSIIKNDTPMIVLYSICTLVLTIIHYSIACCLQDFFEDTIKLLVDMKEKNNDLHRR